MPFIPQRASVENQNGPAALRTVGLWLFVWSASWAKQDNLKALNQRIYKLFDEGKYQEAIPLAEQVVVLTRRSRGPEHPDTATSLENLGQLYYCIGDYAKAELLYQQALRISEKVLGPDHPGTATSLNGLAGLGKARRALGVSPEQVQATIPDGDALLEYLRYRD